jgi:CxxC-x17-CxxC domain-containing protein
LNRVLIFLSVKNMRRFIRDNHSGSRSDNQRSDKPQMHDAVCDECGRDCRVPFRPSGNKPIYCSSCFEKQGGGRSSGRDNRSSGRDYNRGSRDSNRGSRNTEMFSAVCDDCGKDCKVPFKPSSDKPIYCSECFDKRGGGRDGGNRGGGNRNSGNNVQNDQLEAINGKLDRLLSILGGKDLKEFNEVKDTPVIDDVDEIEEIKNGMEEKTLEEVVEKVKKVRKAKKKPAKAKKKKVKKEVVEEVVEKTIDEIIEGA